jgi:16S rRNA (guanine(966)-N(2))-methyltransferase RsmD
MRIIAGTRKGFRLGPVKGRRVRPTQDRVREALFNILEQDGPYTQVADLFAGTGAMGLEALSRWSGKALFVDADPVAIAGLRENLRHLKLEEAGRVVHRDLSRGVGFLEKLGAPFDLIFMDPPYGKGWCLKLVPELLEGALLTKNGVLVLEHDQGDPGPERVGLWLAADQRRYGRTRISFYRHTERE